MRQRRDVARLMTVVGFIAAGVLAAGCDQDSQPVAPEARTSAGPQRFLDDGSLDGIYVAETVVPDEVKQAALLPDALQAALSRSSMPLSASQRALVGAAAGGYDVFAVPFAPEEAPTANNGPTCDDCVMHGVPLGFSFTYWNNTYTNVEIGSNGFVGFGKSGPDFVDNGCCEGGVIPSTTNLTRTPNIIALSWTDWNPTIGGSITYETRGVAPNRKFIVQYTGLREFQTVGTLTAQLVLDESGDITMYTMNQGATRHYVTQGIQNHEGTDAVFWPGRVHAQYSLTNDAIRFTKHIPDTESPVLTIPGDMVVNATKPAGAVVNYLASATDNVGVASFGCVPASGSTFAVGTTNVACNAADAAGNTAAGAFNVKVLGATDQILNLLEYIRGMPLTDIQKTQLTSVLQRALATNTAGVCSAIPKLVQLVRLIPVRSLPADKSAHIIADLTRISGAIGCP